MVPALFLIVLLASPSAWSATPDQPTGVPQEALDRELTVRFSRAYAMAVNALDQHDVQADSAGERLERLSAPEQLDDEVRKEVDRVVDLNGLDESDWQAMLARMEHDDELRERINSLVIPFGDP